MFRSLLRRSVSRVYSIVTTFLNFEARKAQTMNWTHCTGVGWMLVLNSEFLNLYTVMEKSGLLHKPPSHS